MEEDANSKAVAQVPSQIDWRDVDARREPCVAANALFPTVPTQVPAAIPPPEAVIEVSGYDLPSGFHGSRRRQVQRISGK
jgi:hypothetical protein